ncbi:MAG: glucose 1-dehydrogenase [Pseudomonadota bacterium]
MSNLDSKVCLVTGGSSGIGAAVATAFANRGDRVVIADIQDDTGISLAKTLDADYYHLDVTDLMAWTDCVDNTVSKFGRLDVVVNNAGIFRGGTVEEVDLADWNHVLAVNVTGMMFGCKEAIRIMKENPGGPAGSIINVSSIAGLRGLASGVAYCTSKGASTLLTKSVALHCAREYKTIRCNSVHPGAIDTPMNQAAFDASADPKGMRDFFESIQPIGRMITAKEVADGVVFLASDDASSINGTELVIDGGWMAAPNPL